MALQRERQLARYITVDDSELFVVLRVQAEPFEEGLAGEVKEPESFGVRMPFLLYFRLVPTAIVSQIRIN